jgi:hypothetical protein
MAEEITFFSKNDIECPVCNTTFKREELLTGRGRLSAGELTNELRRTYLPTKKFGEITPLLYPVTVCPTCLYAADDFDFLNVPPKAIQNIKNYKDVRANYLIKIFGRIPAFRGNRDLTAGAASYVLAISTYSFFDKKKFSPTIKIGISSLRLAWLLSDLFKKENNPRYQDLMRAFYIKAMEFYDLAINNQSKADEPMENIKSLGPDTDKNFGYDGVLYVSAILKFKNSHLIEDPYEKLKTFEDVKRVLSKVFGIGKKAKDKPEILLSFAKDIYEKIGEETDTLQTSLKNLDAGSPPASPGGAVEP